MLFRQIDHLILCVHGIGQKLGERLEGLNFVHDINVLRRTLKETFASSTDLNILLNNKESEKGSTRKPNCRVQVLPVQWRQEIHFGGAKEYNNNNDDAEKQVDERDIGDAFDDDGVIEDTGNATLKDITVEGLAPIRSLISDGTLPPDSNIDCSVVGHLIILYTTISRTYSPSSSSRNEQNIHPFPPTKPHIQRPCIPHGTQSRKCNLIRHSLSTTLG